MLFDNNELYINIYQALEQFNLINYKLYNIVILSNYLLSELLIIVWILFTLWILNWEILKVFTLNSIQGLYEDFYSFILNVIKQNIGVFYYAFYCILIFWLFGKNNIVYAYDISSRLNDCNIVTIGSSKYFYYQKFYLSYFRTMESFYCIKDEDFFKKVLINNFSSLNINFHSSHDILKLKLSKQSSLSFNKRSGTEYIYNIYHNIFKKEDIICNENIGNLSARIRILDCNLIQYNFVNHTYGKQYLNIVENEDIFKKLSKLDNFYKFKTTGLFKWSQDINIKSHLYGLQKYYHLLVIEYGKLNLLKLYMNLYNNYVWYNLEKKIFFFDKLYIKSPIFDKLYFSEDRINVILRLNFTNLVSWCNLDTMKASSPNEFFCQLITHPKMLYSLIIELNKYNDYNNKEIIVIKHIKSWTKLIYEDVLIYNSWLEDLNTHIPNISLKFPNNFLVLKNLGFSECKCLEDIYTKFVNINEDIFIQSWNQTIENIKYLENNNFSLMKFQINMLNTKLGLLKTKLGLLNIKISWKMM